LCSPGQSKPREWEVHDAGSPETRAGPPLPLKRGGSRPPSSAKGPSRTSRGSARRLDTAPIGGIPVARWPPYNPRTILRPIPRATTPWGDACQVCRTTSRCSVFHLYACSASGHRHWAAEGTPATRWALCVIASEAAACSSNKGDKTKRDETHQAKWSLPVSGLTVVARSSNARTDSRRRRPEEKSEFFDTQSTNGTSG